MTPHGSDEVPETNVVARHDEPARERIPDDVAAWIDEHDVDVVLPSVEAVLTEQRALHADVAPADVAPAAVAPAADVAPDGATRAQGGDPPSDVPTDVPTDVPSDDPSSGEPASAGEAALADLVNNVGDDGGAASG